MNKSALLVPALFAVFGCSSGQGVGPTPFPDPAADSLDAGAGGSLADASIDRGPAPPACSENSPRAVPTELAVLPDDGEAPYLAALGRAKTSIRVLGYQMGFGGVLDTLKAQALAGLSVRVILDVSQKDVNDKYKQALEQAGAKVLWSDPTFTFMHAKIIVVDESEALVGTGNYSRSYMLKERNYLARLQDPSDVVSLLSLFEADWERKAPDLSCTRLVVSPINARERLETLIKSATRTLYIESMQFGDRGIQEAVSARKAAGVDVRVILADPSWIDANTQAAQKLGEQQIPAKWLTNPTVHVKSILVDDERAYIGSENLSYTSISKNREVGVVLAEAPILARIKATFEQDWAAATPF